MEKQIWPHVSAGAKEEGWKAVGATAAVAMEEMDSRLVGHLALAFARNGEPAVAPPLVKLLHNERFHFSVRQGVLDALIRLKNPECIPPLLDVISDPSVSQLLRHGIVSSLDNFGPTVAEASKKKLLAVRDDPKTRVFLYNGINDALLRWRSDGRLADE
jgi:HEAT repeat protein